jgi:hypothetical protein
MFQIASNPEMFYRGIYSSFYCKPESFVYRNYKVDHEKQLMIPQYPDIDLELYNFIHRGQDLSGCGYNYNNNTLFQCETIGFQLSEPDKKNAAEIFIFYILPHRKNPYVIGNSGTRLLNNIMESRNIQQVYATVRCEWELIYTRFGWKIVDNLERTIGKNLYLIQYSH